MSGKCIQPPKQKPTLMRRFYDSGWMHRVTMIMSISAIVLSIASLFIPSATERSEVPPLHAVIRQVDVGDKIHRTVLETEGGSVVVLHDTVKREVGSAIYVGNVDGRWQQVMPPR